MISFIKQCIIVCLLLLLFHRLYHFGKLNIFIIAIHVCLHHLYNKYKCTQYQFIHLLTATLKNSHIENSKNHKRWYCPHHTDCVSMCCCLSGEVW